MVRLCITMFFTGVLFQKTAWGPTSASASLVAVCHRPLARATGRPAIWPSKSCLTWPWTWKISQWMRSVPCWSGAQRPRWTPSNLSKDVERTPDNFCAYRNRSAETATCDGGPNFRKVSRQTDHDSPEAMNQNETSWGFLILFALSSLWKHREFVLHIFICWGLEGLHSVRLVADYKTFFAQMSVDAISMLGDDLSVSSVGIKKVTGGSVTDTMLVEGVCFKKCFSYAGFEQQPKRFENAKILLLNLELELKAEKDNAEVRITDPDQYQSIVDAEWNIIYVPRLQTNCRIILFKEVQFTADAFSVDASTFSTVRSIWFPAVAAVFFLQLLGEAGVDCEVWCKRCAKPFGHWRPCYPAPRVQHLWCMEITTNGAFWCILHYQVWIPYVIHIIYIHYHS